MILSSVASQSKIFWNDLIKKNLIHIVFSNAFAKSTSEENVYNIIDSEYQGKYQGRLHLDLLV